MKPHPNPFHSGNYGGVDTFAVDSTTRIERVKRFTKDECERALKLPGVQKTVLDAVHRRLRQLGRPQ